MSDNQLGEMQGKIILLGKRAIVRMGRNRYIIYLPTSYNKMWNKIHASKCRVLVYVEIPTDKR